MRRNVMTRRRRRRRRCRRRRRRRRRRRVSTGTATQDAIEIVNAKTKHNKRDCKLQHTRNRDENTKQSQATAEEDTRANTEL